MRDLVVEMAVTGKTLKEKPASSLGDFSSGGFLSFDDLYATKKKKPSKKEKPVYKTLAEREHAEIKNKLKSIKVLINSTKYRLALDRIERIEGHMNTVRAIKKSGFYHYLVKYKTKCLTELGLA